jgi:hypothetical protein
MAAEYEVARALWSFFAKLSWIFDSASSETLDVNQILGALSVV